MTARFHLAANVLLSRRLNNLVRIDENVEIDLNYITCAEYQLFIDEMRQAGKNRQPDHWQDYRFPPGDSRKPITGVRASDAQEFCEWLTQQHSFLGFKYRLPTLIEAEENPATEQQIGCWSKDGEKRVIAGIEKANLQDWHSNLAKVTILNRNIDQELYGDLDRVFYLIFYQAPYGDLYGELHRVLYREFYRELYGKLNQNLNLALYGDMNRDLNQVLKQVLQRNLAQNQDRKLERDFYQVLNRNLHQELHGDFNRNFYQVLNQRIQANEASNFLILYFPLLFFIVIYQMLSIKYQAKSQEREALEQINLSSQESEVISHKYQKKINDIYPLYIYLLLQDERQVGRIPAWESIRIVREI